MNQFHQLHKLKNLRKLHQLHKLPQLHWSALPAETTTYKNQQQLQQEVVGMLIYQRLNLALCQVSLSRSLNCNSHMRTVSKYRVIFNWVSKIIRNYIGFAFTFTFTSLCDWSKTLTPLSQPIRCKTKTNHDLVTRVFPRFRQFGCFNLKFSLALPGIFLSSNWPLW